jgi:hypothetical protein
MIKIDNDKINDNAIIDTDKNKNNNKWKKKETKKQWKKERRNIQQKANDTSCVESLANHRCEVMQLAGSWTLNNKVSVHRQSLNYNEMKLMYIKRP